MHVQKRDTVRKARTKSCLIVYVWVKWKQTGWECYLRMWNTACWWKSRRKPVSFLGRQVRESSRGLVGYSLCMHSPSVQFLDWSTMPSQSFPPFLGAGAPHSLLLQWVHSVPQVDHLLHSVHRPSTTTQDRTDERRVNEMANEMMTDKRTSGWGGTSRRCGRETRA